MTASEEMLMLQEYLIALRGGGDLATGVVQKLVRAGFSVVILECERPTAIRRTVSLCEAVYDGQKQVEDIRFRRVETVEEVRACHKKGEVPLLVDPRGEALALLRPDIVVDAIIAKKNIGTRRDMALGTVALGPGFEAGKDVDIVIETMRGHDLGRLLFTGSALPNTGVPGLIAGEGKLRVLHAPCAGMAVLECAIGDIVKKGQTLMTIEKQPVIATIDGRVRGLIRDGHFVSQGMKIGDIDPRTDIDWQTISDKARCLGGAVLEACLLLLRQNQGHV